MLSLLFGPMKITNKLVILSTVIALIIFAITFTQYSLAQEKEEETNARLSNFNHIKKFTSDGKFITSWGSEGDGDGQFLRPEDVAIDSSSGNVFVADFEGNNIQKFDSDGNFITKWGSEGDGDGQFWLPHDIAIDSSDNVYVVDSGNVHEKKDVCAL